MKTISAAALFAALGFLVAGCASGSKALSGSTSAAGTARAKIGVVVRSKVSSGSITVAGTVTISKVKTGTVVRCSGTQLTETVPARSEGFVEGGHWARSGNGKSTSPQDMQLMHLQNGAVTVSCSP